MSFFLSVGRQQDHVWCASYIGGGHAARTAAPNKNTHNIFRADSSPYIRTERETQALEATNYDPLQMRCICTRTRGVLSLERPREVHRAVCVLLTLNRSFYPSTSSTTSARADSSILEEIQVLWSPSYATEILRCHVCSVRVHGAVQRTYVY